METKFQNTFIPKTALDTPSISPPRPASFLTFIAMIIFLISCVLAGGVFLWGQYLTGQVTSLTESLQTSKGEFEPVTIEQYVRLNNRFFNARKLLTSHVAASAFFDLLNKDTLKTIQFSDLKYSQDGSGLISIKMSGKAKSYNSVAYQAKIFSNEAPFKNAVFSNLDLDTAGNVVFVLDSQIDPTLVTYQNNLAAYKALSSSNTLNNPSSVSDNGGGLSFPAAATSSNVIKK
ncbi:MAG: hypothetical protein WCF92_01075 [bacterium]